MYLINIQSYSEVTRKSITRFFIIQFSMCNQGLILVILDYIYKRLAVLFKLKNLEHSVVKCSDV